MKTQEKGFFPHELLANMSINQYNKIEDIKENDSVINNNLVK